MIFSDLKRYFSYLLIYFISFCFFLSTSVQAADIQAQLDNSSNPGFSVQNNGGSTVARVDANGNLTTAGNVGVGTSSTDTLLDVSTGGVPSIVGAGDAFIQNNLEVDGTTYLEGLNMTGTGTFTGLPTFSNGTYSALFTGGNVGIGSSMPGKTLDVLGALRTSQFVMTGQTPISGYVLTATDSLGDASWTASTAVAGSISGLTTNFITKASSSTSITNSLLFDNGTNMGIGSTNPGATLDIQGTLRTTQFTMSGQTPVGGYVLTAVDSNGTTSWSPAGTVSGWTESGANVYETSGGNVGIGSANPGQALDVQGSIRSLGVLDSGVAGSSLVMTNANQLLVAAVAGTNYAAATSGSNLLFGNGAGGFTNVVNTTTSAGNIGLGSTNPGATLDIQGTLRTTQFTMSGQTPVSGYVLTAVDSNGTTSWSPAGSVSGWTESGANVYETSGGNVGIGSTNPGQALDVQGSIRSLGVIDSGVAGSSLVMTNANQQLVAAVAGTNYAAATSGSNLLFGNGAGGFTNVTTTTTNGTNIGVGSTNPGQILDIQGTLRTTQFTMSGQTPVSGYVLTAIDSNGATAWSPAGAVSGWTESGNNVYETSGGNVGIGSTNPGQALDVQGTMRSLGVVTNGAYTQNGTAANTFTGPSTFNNNAYFNGGNVGVGSVNPGQTLDVLGTLRTTQFTMSGQTPVSGYVLTAVDSTGATGWSPAGSVSGWTESGANVYETSGGNVGIGSVNPAQALDVQGTIKSLGLITNGAYTQTGTSANIFTGTATFNNATTSALFSNGNVGINSAAPGQWLDVQGTVRSLGVITGAYTQTGAEANTFTGPSTFNNNTFFSGGNVGVGSTNPGTIFDIQGTLRTTQFTMSGQTPVSGYVLTAVDSTGATSWSPAGSVSGWTESGANVYETSGGNVGIGSVNPAQALDVEGTIKSIGLITNGAYTQTGTSANTFTGTATFNNAMTSALFTGGNVGVGSTNPGQTLDVLGTIRSLAVISGAYTQNGNVANSFTGPSTFSNNTFFNGGNVGVGSSTPGQILDIQGTLRTTQFTMSGQTPVSGYVLTSVDSTGATGWSPAGSVSGWTTSGANVYETSGGNVGIGSANPVQALDVEGTVRSIGVITNGAYTQSGTAANAFTGPSTFSNNTFFNGGNVGVGSTNPGQILDIQGTLRTTQFTMSGQTPVSGYVLTAVDSTGATSWSPAGAVSGWTISGNDLYETNGSGNVGIGSVNPAQALDVEGTIQSIGLITNGGYTQNGTAANTFNGPSTFNNNAFFNSGNVGIGSINPGTSLDIQGTMRSLGVSTNGGYIQSGTAANAFTGPSTFSNNAYFNSGNVGVGSLNPGQALDVQGTVRALAFVGSGAALTNLPAGGAAGSTNQVQYNTTGNLLAGSNNFVFDGTNVGIGSVNPGQTLDIQGTLRTTQFTMSGQTPVGGYVLTAVDSTGATSWSPAGSVSGWTVSGSNLYETNGSGNVGIGSINPAQALDVEGTIQSIGLITNGAYTQNGIAANSFTGTATFSNATNSALFSNGNVGVGSTNPGTVLDIQGTLRTTQFTMSGQTPVSGYVLTAVDSTGTTSWSPAGSVSGWTTSGNNVYATNGSGNVGIGSVNPTQALDVEGTIQSIGLITNGGYAQSGAAANTFTGPSTFSNNAFFNGGNVGVGSTNPGQILDIQGTLRTTQFTMSGQTPVGGYVLTAVDSTGATSWSPAGSVSGWTTSGNNVYETNGSGNVGIGSINPAQALDVQGTIQSIGLITNGAYTQSGTAANAFTGPSTFSNNAFFNGGNVGVGSTNPGQILDIQGTLRTTQFTMSGQTPVGGYVLTAVDSTGATSWSPAGSVSGWTTSGNNVYETNGSGNVGIGSINPAQALDVQGTIQSIGLITNGAYTQSGTAANAFTGPSTFSNNAFFNGGNVGVGSSTPGQILDIQGTLRTTQFTMSGQTPVSGYVLTAVDSTGTTSWSPAGSVSGWTTSGSNLFETNGSGNVGIGSINPAQALDVEGTIQSIGLITNGGYTQSGTAANSFTGTATFSNATNSALFSNGNVGIGSTNPGTVLDIQGTLRTTQFTMSGQTPVSGYVLTAVDSTGATSWSPAGSVSGWTTSGNNVYATNGSGNVGIGSVNPAQALDVEGTIQSIGLITNGAYTQSGVAANTFTGPSTFSNNAYFNSGNVGVGSANPGQSLDVQGTIRSLNIITNGATFTGPSTFSNNAFFNGGNVGVGSSTPGQILDIQGTLRTTQFTMSGQTPVSGYVLTAVDSTGTTSWSPAGSVSGWTTSGNNVYATNGSGNVGIGSINPAQALDVEGTIQSIGLITNGAYTQSGVAANTFTGPSTFSNNAFFNGGNVGVGSSTPGQILDIQGTLRTTQFTMSGQTPVSGYVLTAVDSTGATSWSPAGSVSGWTTSGNNVYATNGSGNVGIGSVNPAQALDVEGTIQSIGLITNGAYTQSGVAANTFTGPSTFSNNAYFNSGNVGVGSANPGQSLDVQGTIRSLNIITNGATFTGPSTFSNNAFFNGGNVGVGSSTPGQILDIQGTLRTTQFTMSGQTPVSGYVLTAVDSTGTTSWSPAGSVSGWTTSGSNLFETNGSGNVGIGSINPAQALDVEGTIQSIGLITNGGYTQSGTAANSFTGTATFSNATNSALFSNGNVGIGSTNPGTVLDIQGTLRTTQFTMSGQTPVSGYVLTAVDSTGATSWSPAGSVSGWTTSGSNLFETNGSGNVGIGSTNPGAPLDVQGTVRFFSGNVGIGSVNPGQALDVQGSIRATGFTLTTGAASGYVLTSNSVGMGTWVAAANSSQWTTANITDVYLPNNGNVGLGTNITNGGALVVMNGNVGIGTWAPTATLQVNGTFSTSGSTGNTTLNTTGGNVGIGTSSPGQTLDVAGAIRGTSIIDTAVANSLLKTSSGTLTAATAGTDYALPTSGSNLLFGNGSGGFTGVTNTSTSNGNIGIGSVNPGQILDIQGTLRTTQFTMSGQTPTSGYVLTASDSLGDTSWSAPGTVGPWTQTGVNIYETGSNVGIGSINPGQILDVQGTVRASGNVGIGSSVVDSSGSPRITLAGGEVDINLQ